MTLSQLLTSDHIFIDLRARDHTDALKRMAGLLGDTWQTKEAIQALMDHESIDGVLLGTGSAVFHAISEDVTDIKVILALSKRGVPHPKRRGFIHIFFLLISPIKESGTHLQLLARIEGLLLNRAFRHAILIARTRGEVLKILKREEESGRDAYILLGREEVFSELGTRADGITEEEVQHRLNIIGPNTLKRVERRRLLYDFIGDLTNLFAILLWIGGGLAFIAGMPELGWAIFLVIIINASFSFWQEYKAERAVEALQRLIPQRVSVVRDGKEKEILASGLVPGDIIILKEGDSVPADGRLIGAEAMRVDNSALTGESKPVYKMAEPVEDGRQFIWTEIPNLIFAGTGVLSGWGKAVVTATGMDTEIGRVAYLTQTLKEEMSPLQWEMVRVTKTVTVIAITLGLVFFLLGYGIAGLTLATSFIFAIGIIVANVPEGLLPTVTLSLAMGVQRMAKKRAVVKRLSAVETLGSTTVICTDKTGTLTTNQMCVERLWVNGKEMDITGHGYEPKGDFIYQGRRLGRDELRREGVEALLIAASLCNNASLIPPTYLKGEEKRGYWSISGDPTEGALIVATEKAGIDVDGLKEKCPRLHHLPFERVRKRMTTIHRMHDAGYRIQDTGYKKSCIMHHASFISFTKGAPKETLALCTHIYKDGKVIHLGNMERGRILKENDIMAGRGLRVLAVAYRDIEPVVSGQWSVVRKNIGKYTVEEVERDLIFLGLIAMVDPPRPEVKSAVTECHRAGIRVIMITGDYGLTARAVAEVVGMKAERVVTSEDLLHLPHRRLRELLKEGEIIFARVTPRDKLRIVSALQENGEVVAVTGDGVNDAPALKKADIGIAMGLRGSDVAKEASEIVLTDDNFATIVEAIREGRAVYANIKKFVTYIFASNIPEIIPFIAFVLFKIPLPLTVMQILAVDLGTDVVPALGLGVEPPEEGIMEKPPRPRHKRLLDFRLLARAYLFLGPIEAVLCLSGFFLAYWLRGWQPGMEMTSTGIIYATATTMSLAGIVTSQIGNVFACRTETESVFKAGLLKNRFVLLGIMVEVALILLLVYTPFLQKVFGLAPLGLVDWTFLLVFGPILLLAEEVRKWWVRIRVQGFVGLNLKQKGTANWQCL